MKTFREFCLTEISWGGLIGAAAGLRLGNGDPNRSQGGRTGLEGIAGAVAGYYAGKALEKKFGNPPANVKPEPHVQEPQKVVLRSRSRSRVDTPANVKPEPRVQQAPKLTIVQSLAKEKAWNAAYDAAVKAANAADRAAKTKTPKFSFFDRNKMAAKMVAARAPLPK